MNKAVLIMIDTYFSILHSNIPEWLHPYLKTPSLERLKGVGLFCGVDYSCLFHPHIFYSRFHHSVGVALIIWHFTKSKKATLAGLLHDVSTPVFSHAIDFKNKDYLKQESTEKDNAKMILEDKQLLSLLNKDNISINDVLHYDAYPVADLKAPALCADRLEYMFSTGYFLCDYFNLESIKTCYEDISIQENGELGFNTKEIAQSFFDSALKVTKLFLEPYDKITLQILACLVDEAFKNNILQPEDIYNKTEKQVIDLFKTSECYDIKKYYYLLTKQKEVLLSKEPLENAYCIKLDVKRRYVDPLINNQRLSTIIPANKKKIDDLFVIDPHYICMKWCA